MFLFLFNFISCDDASLAGWEALTRCNHNVLLTKYTRFMARQSATFHSMSTYFQFAWHSRSRRILIAWLPTSIGVAFLANADFGGKVLPYIGKHGSGGKAGTESTPIPYRIHPVEEYPGSFTLPSTSGFAQGKPEVETFQSYMQSSVTIYTVQYHFYVFYIITIAIYSPYDWLAVPPLTREIQRYNEHFRYIFSPIHQLKLNRQEDRRILILRPAGSN